MKYAHELIPWKVTDISVYPYGDDYWSMNPAIHLDKDGTWRCVTRIVDYAMPGSVTIRSKKARPTGQQTKNAMVILDPSTWKPIQIFKMHERDGLPRASTPHVGYEDMRIFRTAKGGLQGIAASLHLKRETRRDAPQNQPPEQVLLSFDAAFNISTALPIRGGGWSGPQKNWAPFDHCAEPRFLHSINKGSLFGVHGPLEGGAAVVHPLTNAGPVAIQTETVGRAPKEETQDPCSDPPQAPPSRPSARGGSVHVARGRRMMLDAGSVRMGSRPSSSSSSSSLRSSKRDEAPRMMGTGRIGLPTYQGLRGGSQLVCVADGAWLGIAHEMKFVNSKKMYWHIFYLVDSRGKLTATSAPVKLAPEGIEFAAGMAIDVDRVVVSFGVDDMHCRLGETRLSAVMEQLRPVER